MHVVCISANGAAICIFCVISTIQMQMKRLSVGFVYLTARYNNIILDPLIIPTEMCGYCVPCVRANVMYTRDSAFGCMRVR